MVLSLELELDASGAIVGVKNFTKQTEELGKQGKKAADSVKQVETETRRAEAGIKILDGAVNLLGGSLEVIAGGLAASGALTKEQAEEFEGLAVGAIAVADGAKRTLDGIVNLTEGFQLLGKGQKIAAVASKAFGVALRFATGPIGIIIGSITILGGLLFALKDKVKVIGDAFDFFGGILNKVAGALGLAKTETEKLQEASAELAKQGEFELKVLEAQGASREKIVAKERQILKDKIAAEKAGSDEQKALVQELFVFNEKVRNENRTKAKEDAKKRADDAKAANQLFKDQLQKLTDEEIDLKAKTEEEKLKIDFDRTIREINELELSEARKAELRLQAEENYQIKVGQLKEQKIKEQAEKEAALQAQLDQAALDKANEDIVNFSAQLDEIYNLQLSDQQRSLNVIQDKYSQLEEFYKDDAAALKAITEQKEKEITAVTEAGEAARRQIIGGTIDNLQGALTALFGENKAIASANVLIDAAQAAVGIIKNSQSTGPLAIAYQVSQFALLAATTIASLRDINSAQPGSSKTPSTPTPAPIGGGFQAFTGALPGTGGTPTTGLPAGGGRQEPIRAYVIAQDVTTGQEADAAINRRRRLGGG